MLDLSIGGADDVEGVLKRHLLVGLDAIKQRNGRTDGFKIQVADGIFELTEKRGQRRAVNVGLSGEQGGALDGLIVRQFHVGGYIGDLLDALFEQFEGFRSAAIEGEDAGFRQERPAAVVQGTGIGIVAMRADRDFRMRLRADDALHGVNLVCDVAGQRRDRFGYVREREEFLRVNGALPDKFAVDVGEETLAEFDAGTGEHESLERNVGQMNILFQTGGRFDFDQIPRLASDGHENVGAGVAAAERERGLVNRAPLFQGCLGQPESAVEIGGSGINLDAAGKQLFGEFPDLVALVEDGLLGLVGSGNLILGVVTKPEQLQALPPHEEGGLGEAGFAVCWHTYRMVCLSRFGGGQSWQTIQHELDGSFQCHPGIQRRHGSHIGRRMDSANTIMP